MKKVFSILLTMFFVICLTGCGKTDKKSIINKMDKKVNNLNGYKIEAEMELINNEDSYKYDVSVSYKKKDNYRVSLRNKTNNHEQIILKNEDGVYVLTPSLNKSFKFQSKWPYNNSQSYLLQSVINDMKNDSKLSMNKKDGNYIFKSKVNYKNNANLTYQKVTVDKNYMIKSVYVYDRDGNINIKVNYNSIDMKAKFNKNYFILEENMQTFMNESNNNFKVSKLDDAIYPMYLPKGTYLKTEKTVQLDTGSRIILTFSGDKSFMLVEEPTIKEDELTVIPTNGEIDMFTDTIAVVDDSSITWSSDGIDYYMVSSNMSKEELFSVAKSVSTIPISK